LAATPNPSTFGQPVTFVATVKGIGGTPAGTVSFTDGATTLGTAFLDNNGQATFITSALTIGRHTIIANHGGDPNFVASKSLLSQMVNAKIPRRRLLRPTDRYSLRYGPEHSTER
jgi:hypothetical protein